MENIKFSNKQEKRPATLERVVDVVKSFWRGKEYCEISRDGNLVDFTIAAKDMSNMLAIDLAEELSAIGFEPVIEGNKVYFSGKFSNEEIEKFERELDIRTADELVAA